ncbi:MAG: hypothetical protein ACREPQ_13955 [Rhodanobacter sp.]
MTSKTISVSLQRDSRTGQFVIDTRITKVRVTQAKAGQFTPATVTAKKGVRSVPGTLLKQAGKKIKVGQVGAKKAAARHAK